VHLGDLLLRRTRIGLVMPGGGAALLPRIGEICRAELGWDKARWERESMDYQAHWRAHHFAIVRPTKRTVGGEMKSPKILAIDVGTQSARTIVFDVEGRLVAKAQTIFEPTYFSRQPGWAEQDPEVYWAAVQQSCEKLCGIRRPGQRRSRV